MNRLIRLFLMVLLVTLTVERAMACSVCQGDPNSEMTEGARAGVLMMVAVTYLLLLGVGGIVVSWIVRARRTGRSF